MGAHWRTCAQTHNTTACVLLVDPPCPPSPAPRHAFSQSVTEGYNGTLLAYGQTGTGKTHTMLGPPPPSGPPGLGSLGSSFGPGGFGAGSGAGSGGGAPGGSGTAAADSTLSFGTFGPSSRGFGASLRPLSRAGGAPPPAPTAGDPGGGGPGGGGEEEEEALPAVLLGPTSGAAREDRGLIPRALEHLFAIVARDTAHSYDISVAYVQIYCELVHDLLVAEPAEKNLLLREDGEGVVYVEGVSRVRVHDAGACLQLLAQGHRNRATARTR